MITRIVPAAVLGAIAAELSINLVADALVARVEYPLVSAFVAVPAAIGLIVGLVGLLATPAVTPKRCWRQGL